MIRWSRNEGSPSVPRYRELATFPTRVSPLLRAEDIRNFLTINYDYIVDTDLLEFTGKADFTYGQELNLPAAIYTSPTLQTRYNPNSHSLLPGAALWTHGNPLDSVLSKPNQTPGFTLPAGNIEFRNFYLHNSCYNPRLDGCLIGWSLDTGTGTTGTAKFRNCILDGSQNCDWVFYNWHTGNKTIDIRQSKLYYCRIGIGALSGSGSGTQTVYLEDVLGYGDANGSISARPSSALNEVIGGVLTMLVNRKGASSLQRCTATSKGILANYNFSGSYGCSRIASLFTNQYSVGSAGTTSWTILNSSSDITPGVESVGVRNDYDLRGSLFALTVAKGLGIGTSGDLKAYTP